MPPVLTRSRASNLLLWGNFLLLPLSLYLCFWAAGRPLAAPASPATVNREASASPVWPTPAPGSQGLIPSGSGRSACGPPVEKVRQRAAALRALLIDKGTLAIKFRLATPDPPALAERVSHHVANVLSGDAGSSLPHSVECRGRICKVVVVRPPDQALDRFGYPTPCTSQSMNPVMAYSWTQTNVAIQKREPLTGQYSWEDECFLKLKDRL
jgi:hypothetical protein